MIFKDKKCPICEQKMTCDSYSENGIESESYESCKNKCYAYDFSYGSNKVTIFDNYEVEWYYNTPEYELKQIEKDIQDQINYWRYNDRYLIELLTR